MDIVGRVRTGLGKGAGFTSMPWANRQFLHGLGIESFPGTLNLQVDPAGLAAWQDLQAQPGLSLVPERASDCGARCYPVLALGPRQEPVTAGIVLPAVPGYLPDQVEVLASVGLREMLQVRDGDLVTLQTVPVRNRRAVLFDVDGTLVDSIEGYRLAAERAVQPFGWEVPATAVSRAMNFGDSFWDLVVPAESRGDPELSARLRQATMAHWPDILESVMLYPGIGATLARLKAAGVRLGICTASRGESFRPLEEAGLLDYFEEIVTAEDVTRRKPDPEGILLCMARMGLRAGETIYIGDTVADIRASRAAGLYAVGVLTGAGSSSLLSEAGAHRILPDLGHLPELLLGGG
ncbi:MAG: HAD-IA family hydrolase [Gammaproteobacteria bacterium]